MDIQGRNKANIAFDPRHARPRGIAPPQEEGESIFLRCRIDKAGCNRLYSNWEFRRNGGCPHCGCIYSWGSFPRGKRFKLFKKYEVYFHWEWVRIFFWSILGNWRMLGPERGWGWNLKPVLPLEMREKTTLSS